MLLFYYFLKQILNNRDKVIKINSNSFYKVFLIKLMIMDKIYFINYNYNVIMQGINFNQRPTS